jgi:dihydroxy-acid dehydratase
LGEKQYDLIDAMIMSADSSVPDEEVARVEQVACPTCGSCSGMFTANSMNCLTEAMGLALPGNGTVVATHTERRKLFSRAAERIVELTERYYEQEDESVLPRAIATQAAFRNAMALDIAMGGSTNTVLHLLAAADVAEVDFTLADVDELSQAVPNISRVAPSSRYHIEDVNRAGGILSIMGELARGKLLDTAVRRVDGLSLAEAIERYDLRSAAVSEEARALYTAASAGTGRNLEFASQDARYEALDLDRASGCIRDIEHAYYRQGGLAVLYGNIAREGCVVKTAGVHETLLTFSGTARVYESQDEAVEGILGDEVRPGDVVIIRYEGPKGGPGMQEMLYPTSYLKSQHLDTACALLTDGRFSGGTSGLSIGHASPEAAAGGEIGLLRDGDTIDIDIPARRIEARLDADTLAARRAEEEARGESAFTPHTQRERPVSAALRAYAALASSAHTGAVRNV